MFEPYLTAWNLERAGSAIETHASRLLPVRFGGARAMLKLATADEERRGAEMLAWWDGAGAARVLRRDGPACLLEYAEGERDLADMARESYAGDDEACRILCSVAMTLHAAPGPVPPIAIPLEARFAALEATANARGGVFSTAWDHAQALLADQSGVAPLHGDIHHGNVLDFGPRGWLAIDPKGLVGDRAFDFANIFTNPDPDTATAKGTFKRRLVTVSDAAGIAPDQLAKWIVAWCGLSAAWHLQDAQPAETPLRVAELALAALDS